MIPLWSIPEVKVAATFIVVASLERMRPLKIIMTAFIAALVVLAGLFIAAVAAVTGAALFFLKRSRGTPASRRTTRLSRLGDANSPKGTDLDVVDVTATEVPADPAKR